MGTLTASNWIALLGIIAAGGIAFLVAQRQLITSLFKAQHEAHNAKHAGIEKRLDGHDEAFEDVRLDVKELQTVCRMRHEPRADVKWEGI